jgi:hypothetical protein
MNSLKKPMRLAKIWALALSFLMLCFPAVAMAATGSFTEAVEESITITGGSFNVNSPGSVPTPITIRSAIVSLPPGETGRVNQIVIIGPDGKREFGCQNIKVQNGTDLIKECGGPAVLQAGSTTYEAQGSNFSPNPNIQFSIDLKDKD